MLCLWECQHVQIPQAACGSFAEESLISDFSTDLRSFNDDSWAISTDFRSYNAEFPGFLADFVSFSTDLRFPTLISGLSVLTSDLSELNSGPSVLLSGLSAPISGLSMLISAPPAPISDLSVLHELQLSV